MDRLCPDRRADLVSSMDSPSNTIRCPRCRKDLPAGTAFCRRCGEALPGHRPEPSPQTDHDYVPSDVGRHVRPGGHSDGVRYAFLAAAFLALGLLVVILWVASRRRASVAMPNPPAAIPFAPAMPPRMAPAALPLTPLPAWQRHLPADLPPAREGPDYRGQILQQGRFASLPLSDLVFAGADLLQADFARADLDGADFRGADLSQADFGGADLAGAKFDEAQIHQTQFVGADTAAVAGKTRLRDGIVLPLPPPRLTAKHLGQASFRGARVTQVSFEDLDLAGVDFSGAELSSVDFRNANLSHANLRDTRQELTDFQGARLEGADLRGADLSSVLNLTPAQLASARTDAATRLPRW